MARLIKTEAEKKLARETQVYRSLEMISKQAILLYALVTIYHAVMLATILIDPRLITHLIASNTSNDTFPTILIIIAIIPGAMIIFSDLAFLNWYSCAHQNLQSLKPHRIEHNSNMIVWYYFVPIGNYILPYGVLQEIWRESYPDYKNHRSGSLMVFLWWIMICSKSLVPLGMVILTVSLTISNPGIPQNPGEGFVPAIGAVYLAVSLITIWYISTINKHQEERFRLINTDNQKPKPSEPIEPMAIKEPEKTKSSQNLPSWMKRTN